MLNDRLLICAKKLEIFYSRIGLSACSAFFLPSKTVRYNRVPPTACLSPRAELPPTLLILREQASGNRAPDLSSNSGDGIHRDLRVQLPSMSISGVLVLPMGE